MNRFMPRYHQKDLIILFFGEIPKKRDATGSVRDNPVQRGEPVRAAVVQISVKNSHITLRKTPLPTKASENSCSFSLTSTFGGAL